MKKGMLFFVFILLAINSRGQGVGICDMPGNAGGPYVLDSSDFSGGYGVNFYYQIDTTLSNNIWQIGSVIKSGFPSNTFGSNAMQTDTAMAYGIKNISAFCVWTDTTMYFASHDSLISIHFWHYYDVDSLGDSCIVQITLDSGKTWLNYSEISMFSITEYDYQISPTLAPYSSGKFLWNGVSAGWQQAQICFIYYAIKPSRSLDWPVGFRFMFKSDSVQTNRPGWMIDKIRFRTPIGVGPLVRNFERETLSIYPNPSASGKFTIDFPSNYVSGKFMVYDYLGRKVKTVPLAERIDLSSLPSGLYSYKALFEKTNQWFSGKIEIR